MVLPSLVAAGMETMVVRLCRRLTARGHQVGVSCILERGALAAGLEASGVRVALVPTPGVVTNLWPRNLSGHLSTVAPDVLHIHSGVWLKAAMAGRRSRTPLIIYTAHGLVDVEPWHYKYFELAGSILTDRVVAVSEHLRRHLVGRGIPASKISVIINGIHPAAFYPRQPTGTLRKRLGIGETAVVIGTVARLESVKNQAMLLRAIALARDAGSDCEVVLVGDGPLRRDLEQQAESLGIADKTHFWGFEAEVSRIYPEFDVFALTSVVEGTSISLLEAMASGLCCIATAVGGNVDLLDHGACGELVSLDRPDDLARVISRLAAEPDRRRTLGQKARARVETHFSEARMVEHYECLYRNRRHERTARESLETT
jgi:glycosyltransferase involved in cell wall biosynthesis